MYVAYIYCHTCFFLFVVFAKTGKTLLLYSHPCSPPPPFPYATFKSFRFFPHLLNVHCEPYQVYNSSRCVCACVFVREREKVIPGECVGGRITLVSNQQPNFLLAVGVWKGRGWSSTCHSVLTGGQQRPQSLTPSCSKSLHALLSRRHYFISLCIACL